jgi:hypothetical protein
MDFTPKQKTWCWFGEVRKEVQLMCNEIFGQIWNWGQKFNQNSRPEMVKQNYGFVKLKQKEAKHKA